MSRELDLKKDEPSFVSFVSCGFKEAENSIATSVGLTHRKALEGWKCLKEQALAQLLEAFRVELFVLV